MHFILHVTWQAKANERIAAVAAQLSVGDAIILRQQRVQ
jgi:hypothetical protein